MRKKLTLVYLTIVLSTYSAMAQVMVQTPEKGDWEKTGEALKHFFHDIVNWVSNLF